MSNPFEKFNEEKVNKVEMAAFLNREAFPESQMKQLDVQDKKIEDTEGQINDIIFVNDFSPDFTNSKNSLKLEERLIEEENKKKWMVKGN